MILSKSAYAAARGVAPSAISKWISRGKLTAPALRTDGKIDADAADAQLKGSVAPVQQASAMARRGSSPGAPADAAGADWSPSAQASTQLLRARALSASIAAERSRRELMAERGKYMLTAEAEAAWARSLTNFLLAVEQSFPELAIVLQLDREKQIALRRWWRNLRLRESEPHRLAAEVEPQFVGDVIA
jgi:hypothetical protein